MDPSTVIVNAVVAGAALALKDVTSNVVKGAYAGLKQLIIDKYGKKGLIEQSLKNVEDDPESVPRQSLLEEELQKAGAAQDEQLLEAAKALLEKADPEGTRQGNYVLSLRAGDKSIQIGQARDVTIGKKP